MQPKIWARSGSTYLCTVYSQSGRSYELLHSLSGVFSLFKVCNSNNNKSLVHFFLTAGSYFPALKVHFSFKCQVFVLGKSSCTGEPAPEALSGLNKKSVVFSGLFKDKLLSNTRIKYNWQSGYWEQNGLNVPVVSESWNPALCSAFRLNTKPAHRLNPKPLILDTKCTALPRTYVIHSIHHVGHLYRH